MTSSRAFQAARASRFGALRRKASCIALPLLAGLASGCVSPPIEGAPSRFAPPMRLVGTEPFWAADVTSSRITLSGVDRPTLAAAIDWKRSSVGPGGARYLAAPVEGAGVASLAVALEPGPCSDGMSDRRYPFTASVSVTRVGGGPAELLKGCGAPPDAFATGS